MRIVVGLCALQVVFFALLVVGQAVPDRPIIENLAQSVDRGTYGPSALPDRMGGQSDTFTECVVVGTGLGADRSSSIIERAVAMPRIDSCVKGADQITALAAEPEKAVESSDYFRYWAGYTVLTRPVLATVGMEGLRIVAGFLLLASAIIVAVVVARATSVAASVGLLAPLALSTNMMSTPSTSLSHALSISAIFLGTALVTFAISRRPEMLTEAILFSASAFCFIDLLTTPAIPWAFCAAVVAGVAACSRYATKRMLKVTVAAAVLWPLGFAFTWVSRWSIAAVFLGWDTTTVAVRDKVETRVAGQSSKVGDGIGSAVGANWNYWLDNVPTAPAVLALSVLAVLGMVIIAVVRRDLKALVIAAFIGATSLVIPIWYAVLSNHSQIHTFFVYRGIPALLGIVLFGFVVSRSACRESDSSLLRAGQCWLVADDSTRTVSERDGN